MPEIFRVPLDSILLQMISMGLPNVREFPFIEAPEAEAIEQTILGLKQHVSWLKIFKAVFIMKFFASSAECFDWRRKNNSSGQIIVQFTRGNLHWQNAANGLCVSGYRENFNLGRNNVSAKSIYTASLFRFKV